MTRSFEVRNFASLNVLIVSDKLKGTLTAVQAATAMKKGWRKSRPQDAIELLPMSDGGDGFGEVLGKLLKAKRRKLNTLDAAHRHCSAHWWWEASTKTAIVESASIIGLAMLPPKKFHPFELDTFGLGCAIKKIAAEGAQKCFVGIGGSATNDGGFGLARALGWKFFDSANVLIENWTDLFRLQRILAPTKQSHLPQLFVATDVQNPLLGSRGATRVYGPQKGLAEKDFPPAELCLRRLAHVVNRTTGRNVACSPGAGAAGGLGFGLLAFGNARMERGFELFSGQARLNQRLRKADVVLTAEGALDRSTLMGKGVGELARRCRELALPCIALAGTVSGDFKGANLFTQMHALTDLTSLPRAKQQTSFWLTRLTEQVAKAWDSSKPKR